jgi:uncharacterized protein (TIRG00374 family)
LRRILQIALVVTLTVVFLALFLWNANLRDVWKIIKSANPWWLAVGMFVNWSALGFRTLRWRTVLNPDDPPPFYATYFANTVGYMLSTVLPIRAADVARPALLARRTNLRFSGALGTVLIERVLDLFMILILFIYFAAVHWNDFSHDASVARWFFVIKAGAIASVVTLAALIFFIFGIYFFRGRIRRMHEFLGRFIPARFREPWMHFFDTFTESFAITKHHRAFAKIVLCTMAVWACLTSQFWFTAIALGESLPFDSSIFVTGITTVGLAIPTPGGIGGFHKACQLVLTNFYHFDVDTSVATAILFHIVGTLPVIVTGLVLFAHEGLRWRDVKGAVEGDEADEAKGKS